MLKPLTVWVTTNYGQFFKRWEYQTTLPASWKTCIQVKTTVKTRHETANWFKIGKGVHQGCILTLCLLKVYAEYIMWNAGLNEAQDGIKIARININKLRYADGTTLMAESKEELKSILMKMKEKSEKADWNSVFKKLRLWHPGLYLMAKIDGENGKSETLFSWAPKPLWMVTAAMKLKDAYSLGEKVWQT